VKRAALAVIAVVAQIWRLVPYALRRRLIFSLAVLETRIGAPADSLRRLYPIADDIEKAINERAMAYGRGEHPKHELTRYHDFFTDRIADGSRVLDIGCGYGAVARTIARHVADSRVTGIDIDAANIAQAMAADNPDNLDFVIGDALRDLPNGDWNVVVLSNVLEHIDARIDFLRALGSNLAPETLLIRVPLFERSWHIPMRRALGIGYFSDATHFVEHTRDGFDAELAQAGFEIVERQTLWGEIWASCRPRADA
jgi:SAM-dependent methyltransferase